jgi:hypothetical protein
MNPKRFFFIMIGVFALSIVGGGAMLYTANSMLKKRSVDVVALRLESTVLEEQQNAYKIAKTNVEKYNYLNDIIKSALPQDKDQARTVREIFLLAEQSGITVNSIQFPSSTLGTVTSAAGAAAAVGGITQAKPVEGLKGVYSIETIVTPYADNKTYKVTYNQLIDFLKRIESNRRAMQVANIQLTPLGQNPTDSISFTLTLNIFIKP